MHELSVVENIVRTSDQIAREKGAASVQFLTLVIGQATGVEPRYVRMYFTDVSEGTLLEGAELRIEEVQTEAFCRNCGNTFYPDETLDVCPECLDRDYELLHGGELMIKEMGLI